MIAFPGERWGARCFEVARQLEPRLALRWIRDPGRQLERVVLRRHLAIAFVRRAESLVMKAMFLLVQVATASLARIASLLDGGQLMPTRVGTVLPLTDARAAHEMLDGSSPGLAARSCCRCARASAAHLARLLDEDLVGALRA